MVAPLDKVKALEEALLDYSKVRPLYELLAKYLERRCAALASDLGVYPLITARAKSLESFADKCSRKAAPDVVLADRVRRFTDLCGVRVILHTLDEVEAFVDLVSTSREFEVKDSQDALHRLDPTAFGYRSRHLDLRVRKLVDEERQDRELAEFLESRNFAVVAELQVRTIAQHAWADAYHDLGYKNEFELPEQWKRDFALAAAHLEAVDRLLLGIKEGMRLTSSSWSEAAMREDKLTELAWRLEAVVRLSSPKDRGNVALARTLHRLIRIYRILEGSNEKLKALVGRYAPIIRSYPPARRDLGAAYIQMARFAGAKTGYFETGGRLLESVIAENPKDIDALCSLAGARRRQGKREEAKRLYFKAHQLDPCDPYPLGNYIAEELHSGNSAVLPPLQSTIKQAIKRCQLQVEGKVNLPWALFDLGLFHLYLNRSLHALLCYAQGTAAAPRAWMKQSALYVLQQLEEIPLHCTGLSLVRKLLDARLWLDMPDDRKGREAADQFFTSEKPVTLLAGLCTSPGLERAITAAFRSLRGVVVCVGPMELAQAVLAAFAKHGTSVEKLLVWAPKGRLVLPADPAVRFHRLPSKKFGPDAILALWHSLVIHGPAVGRIKLLGFGGDEVSVCHYAVAQALGAQVGVVGDAVWEGRSGSPSAWWPSVLPGPPPSQLSTETIAQFLATEGKT
jgi:ppGpp synthetase/RelA/SpoT-type nucleotidyltranferase